MPGTHPAPPTLRRSYEPDRGSLYRTFLDLKQEGALVVQKRDSGRSPTLYRKTIASDATAAE